MESVSTTAGHLVIIGDFNIHWDDSKNHFRIQFAELLESFDLKQHIVQPTHIKGHTIDYIITRTPDNILHNVVVDSLISDHHAIISSLNVIQPPPQKKKITFRKLKNIDFSDFNNDLSKCLQSISNCNLNDKVSGYMKSVTAVLNKHAPMK